MVSAGILAVSQGLQMGLGTSDLTDLNLILSRHTKNVMGDIEASVTSEPSSMGTNSTNEEDHENSTRKNKSGKSVTNSYQSINVLIRTRSQVEER